MTSANAACEAEIQSQILEYLKLRGIKAYRNNTRSVKLGGRLVQMGLCKGSSDIIGVLPGGRFLAIEVKRPRGKATDEQIDFLLQIRKAGGVAFIATSVEQTAKMLDGIGVNHGNKKVC